MSKFSMHDPKTQTANDRLFATKPTKIAIEQVYPRMPKGAIIAFDELAQAN
jgi:hypothetical protein